MKKGIYWFKLFQMTGDVIGLILGFILSYWFRFNSGVIPIFHYPIPSFELYLYSFLIVFFLALVTYVLTGLYKIEEHGFSFFDESFEVIKSNIILGFVVTGLSFFYRRILYSRLVVVLFFLFATLLIILFRGLVRLYIRYLINKGISIWRVLLVGEGEILNATRARIENSRALGYVMEEVLSTEEFLKRDNPTFCNMVFIALPLAKNNLLPEILKKAENWEVSIRIVPDVYQLMSSGAGIYRIGGLPLVAIKEPTLSLSQRIIKRTFDIVFSALVLIFLSPIFLVVSLLIKLTSKGPVFYRQERIGKDGKIFNLIKFRTMVVGADREDKPRFTSSNDVRITPIGKFLRSFSIDEFPQFINVLKGDMSTVGPRPERPYFVKQFVQEFPRYLERHRVKTGITGWAQINGLRGDTSIAERLRYDLYYIQNWSLYFDIKIIAKTALNFLSQKNAY